MPKHDARIDRMNGVAARVESISGRFLGYPYLAHSLVGSVDTPEVFNDSLMGFDCVTYIESVMALVYAGKTGNYSSILTKLRYSNGRVDWRRRNHYMTQWLKNNARHGLIRRVGLRFATTRKQRLLNVVPGLPASRQSFSCIPKSRFSTLDSEICTGDLIFFASTRSNLDVFHCGILIRRGETWILRHASRSRGSVVDQDLLSFLKENRMAGVMLARPCDRSRR
jgi:cell wall-associated NlpC family hydrolase